MTTIYLDSGVLMIAGGMAASRSLTLRDDAARLIGHLLASGHEVLLLGEADQIRAARESLPPRCQVAVAPEGWPAGEGRTATGWLVTDSPGRCAAKREHPRLRTVLVAASSRASDLAHRPADRLARSLGSAILEILVAEATG